MGKINFARKVEEIQRIQELLKKARQLVEKDLGRKVLDAYLQGNGEREIYELVRHIVSDVYAFDKIHSMKAPAVKKKQKTGVSVNDSGESRDIEKIQESENSEESQEQDEEANSGWLSRF